MATLTVNGNGFTVYNLSDVLDGRVQLPSEGSVYLFTKMKITRMGSGNHTILYVGQTGNLSDRNIRYHQQLACVHRHEGNCLCVHYDYDESSRLFKENSIKQDYDPPCNGAPVAQ